MFNLEEYEAAAAKGRLSRGVSPCGRYVTFKYSKQTTFARDWDFLTLTARGHVWDSETGLCVGAPFDKFFNFGELSPSFEGSAKRNSVLKNFISRWEDDELLEAVPWEKLDGSMGLIWRDHTSALRVNTPGSFVSDQAQWAQEWLRERDEISRAVHAAFDRGIHSLCVEIIYPGNKIVVPYPRERHGLHLTGASSDPHTYWNNLFEGRLESAERADNGAGQLWGRWLGADALNALSVALGLPCAQIFEASPAELIDRASKSGTGDECEGWVFQNPRSGARIKIKCADYVALHRIATNVHPNRVKDILEAESCWGRIVPSSEKWIAASAALMEWMTAIDEEYREPYEAFVKAVLNDIKAMEKKVLSATKTLQRQGFLTNGDVGRAVAKGLITLPKGVDVGAICDCLRMGQASVDTRLIFESAKARIFGDQ
jgi:hypothetical protein